MTKDEKIAKYLKEPIKKGDRIQVKGLSYKDKEKEETVTVECVDGNKVYFAVYGYNELLERELSEVRKDIFKIGNNPFRKEIRTTSYQIDIQQLFWRCGFDKKDKRMEEYFGVDVPETCLNPIVINENGEEVEYQRGLVWSLEQKQLLIESIYNNVEIGKFVLRKRKFDWVENRIKEGRIDHTAFNDLVDGKQRFTALLDFYNDVFPDMNGEYFSSFSNEAKHRFLSYRHLTYVELDENSTDADILAVFLAINFTGVPMSMDHINFVRSIKTK